MEREFLEILESLTDQQERERKQLEQDFKNCLLELLDREKQRQEILHRAINQLNKAREIVDKKEGK